MLFHAPRVVRIGNITPDGKRDYATTGKEWVKAMNHAFLNEIGTFVTMSEFNPSFVHFVRVHLGGQYGTRFPANGIVNQPKYMHALRRQVPELHFHP